MLFTENVNPVKTTKFSPPLTDRRRKLRNAAQNKYERNESVNFVFADIHGDLKVRFHHLIDNDYVHSFREMNDIDELLMMSTHDFDVEESDL